MSWTITPQTKVPVDPYRSQVSLLLHGDGTNGSTTITDSSPTPKTVTAFGNAQISTAVADPFGNTTGVLAFDGNGDYLTLSNSPDLTIGLSSYTAEAWVNPLNKTFDFGTILGGSATNSFLLSLRTTTGTVPDRIYINAYGGAGGSQEVSFAFSVGIWSHVAVSRQGTDSRIFVNGLQIGSTATDSRNYSAQANVVAGILPLSQSYAGYLSNIRITKGVARYTSNFTPPTGPFPDI